jgi:tungstate transport system substrate-binding protein
MKKLVALLAIFAAAVMAWLWFRGARGPGAAHTLRLATTTSVVDSGLLRVLAPAFEKQSGYRLDVQSIGSGKAIESLRDGKADVAISHAPDDEARALAAGEIGARTVFMQDEFILLGPKAKAGVVAGAASAVEALRRIAASGSEFLSRGDRSGTHQLELSLWQAAGVGPNSGFIVQANASMSATLERASKEAAFTISDRPTYLPRRKNLDLVIVFQGDPVLRNHYSVLQPTQSSDGARALAAFVRSDAGRALIGSFGVEHLGEALFTPEQ